MIVVLLAAPGCGLFNNKKDDPYFRPQDFQPTMEAPADEGDDTASDDTTAGKPTYAVNAMLGLVDGQPLYASDVLDPIGRVLEDKGSTLPRNEFLRFAVPLIDERLKQVVLTELILSDAERDLGEQQQAVLRHMVAEKRAEFVRVKGEGSELLANQRIIEDTKGVYDLEGLVEEYRRATVIHSYRSKHIMPEIIVSRRMIEQYYERRPDEFNKPEQRVVRWIRADKADAPKVQALLDEGKPFAEVASMQINRNNPENGGLFGETGVTQGDEVFPEILEDLNKQLPQLSEGEYSKPVEVRNFVCWVFVEKYEPAKTISLFDAQDAIAATLREKAFTERMTDYRSELLESGRFDDLEQMRNTLIEVAVGRYVVTQ